MKDKLIASFASASLCFLLNISAARAAFDEWQACIDKGKFAASNDDYVEAETQYSKAFNFVEAFGSQDIRYSQSLNKLAGAQLAQKHYDQAVDTYQRVIAAQEKYYGECDPQVALTIKALVGIYCVRGKHSQAEPFARRVLAIDEKNFGIDHPEITNDLNQLSTVLCFERKSEEAEASLLRALEIQKRYGFSVNVSTVDTMRHVAWAFYLQRKFDSARRWYEAVLESKKKLFGENHAEMDGVFRDLAMVNKSMNDRKKVVEYCEKSNAIVESQADKTTAQKVSSLYTLAGAHIEAGDYEKAQFLVERALNMIEADKNSSENQVSEALHRLVIEYVRQNKFDQVKPYFERLAKLRSKELESQIAKSNGGKSLQRVVIGYNNLGVMSLNCKQYADAEKFFTQAISIDPNYRLAYENRAITRTATGNTKGAEEDREVARTKGAWTMPLKIEPSK